MEELTKETFKALLQKKGPLSHKEIASIKAYLDNSNRSEVEPMLLELYEKDLSNDFKLPIKKTAIIWQQIESNISLNVYTRKKENYKIYLYAAIFLGIILLSTVFWFFTRENNRNSKYATLINNKEQNVPPGKNGAILTLSDGSQMVLDSTGNGVITGKNGATILKTKDGGLVYDKGLGNGKNKLETTVGRTYQVLLPDGSKIVLNASSYLEYPMEFQGRYREVVVSGEAYFEVAHDVNHPFIVHIKADNRETSSIKVLGTHFDVKSYANDNYEETTLCEGSVQYISGNYTTVLKPGHQLQKNAHSATIDIKKIEVDDVIAWVKGDFNFNNATLQEIMKQLDRWYGTQTVYKSKIPDMIFNGVISRNSDLKSVMKILEFEGVHYQLNNKQIMIE